MRLFLSDEVREIMNSEDKIKGELEHRRRYHKPVKANVRDVQRALAALEYEQDPFHDGQMDIEGAICAGGLLAQMRCFVRDYGASGDRRLVALLDAVLDEPVEDYFKRSYGLVESDCTAASRIVAAVSKHLAQLGDSAKIAVK